MHVTTCTVHVHVPPIGLHMCSVLIALCKRMYTHVSVSSLLSLWCTGIYMYLYHAYYESYNLIGQCEVLYFTY